MKDINLNKSSKNHREIDSSKKYAIKLNRKYAVFLKRKRLENNLTLEAMAQGICTASYLCRIENNIVDVSDEYYVALFKKLDIDYYSLREVKERSLFSELLKCYLLQELNDANTLISGALKTNYYVDVEFELMVLFDKIIKENYNEARIDIERINTKLDLLLDDELVFYLFLTALYAYKTYQGLFAFKQIVLLCEMELSFDTTFIYKYAILDLALDIFTYCNSLNMFFKYYYELNNDYFLSAYSSTSLKHQAQLTYNTFSYRRNDTSNNLYNIKLIVNDNYKNDIDYLIMMNYFRFEQYNDMFELAKTVNSGRSLALMSVVLLIKNDSNLLYEFNELLNKYDFLPHERLYESICTFIITYRKGVYTHTTKGYESFTLIKDIVKRLSDSYYDSFFLNICVKLLLDVAHICGKYKEALKVVNDYMKIRDKVPFYL